MSALRNNDLAKIHMAKKDLAMTDDSYQALLKRLTRKISSKDLNITERVKVLAEFARLGWSPKTKKQGRAKGYTRPKSKKIVALWLALYDAGKVRNRTNAALLAFTARTTGRESLKTLDWLADTEADTVINALNQWVKR